jgi:iron complex outermembrane receptor protein
MAERYTATDLGGLNIFPNPDLDPETGWSVEAGLRQGFRIGEWQGFIDLAGFQMRYHDMMEFTFGIYKPDSVEIPTLDHLGFMSVNIGDTRITGIDISVNGQGNIGNARITFLAGYTYIDPVEMATDSTEEIVMKYRYRHSAKGDLQASVGKFSAGLTLIYTSFMERIDAAFEEMILGQEFFPGLKEYRQENNDGALVVDARVAYQISRASQAGLYIRNLFNEEYMGRPGDIMPPVNITIQYRLTL